MLRILSVCLCSAIPIMAMVYFASLDPDSAQGMVSSWVGMAAWWSMMALWDTLMFIAPIISAGLVGWGIGMQKHALSLKSGSFITLKSPCTFVDKMALICGGVSALSVLLVFWDAPRHIIIAHFAVIFVAEFFRSPITSGNEKVSRGFSTAVMLILTLIAIFLISQEKIDGKLVVASQTYLEQPQSMRKAIDDSIQEFYRKRHQAYSEHSRLSLKGADALDDVYRGDPRKFKEQLPGAFILKENKGYGVDCAKDEDGNARFVGWSGSRELVMVANRFCARHQAGEIPAEKGFLAQEQLPG